MKDPFAGLNEEQRQVVEATHGPVLVLAGAGSGKTKALTHRIAYLLQRAIAGPEQILAVTFTNKAAGEMRERVAQLLESSQAAPRNMGTFHSLGARMLREQHAHIPRSAGFTIMDTGDSERMVKQALDGLGLAIRQWPPRQLRNRISKAKNDLLTPADAARQASSYDDEVFSKVFARYEQLLKQHDSYDFDDLLTEPLRLLQAEEAVRKQYQQRWRFLCVDEYQDTNPVQDALLALMLNEEKNICVVGDDYQAIYSWRGAKVDHILKFESRFPNCTTVYLTQNYRSTPAILEAANRVIAENTVQKHKRLWTQSAAGAPVRLAAVATDYDEARLVGSTVASALAAGERADSFAVLYRTNAQSRLFEEYFVRHNIPYYIVGGVRFYERAEVKDALALLQLLLNPQAGLALKRLVKVLARGVGMKTADTLTQQAREAGMPLREAIASTEWLTERQRASLSALHRAMKAGEAEAETVREKLATMLTTSGYINYIKGQPDGEDRMENIEELLSVAARHTDANLFLEEAALMSDADDAAARKDTRNKVACMTLHAAKGLEFKHVFVAGCEENLLPHRNSTMSTAELEEERRLLYVGITRARESLVLTYAHLRTWHGETVPQLPSRFLDALPEEVQRLDGNGEASAPRANDGEAVYEEHEIGDLISHPIFGRGVVIEVNGSTVTGVFEGHGMKTISV